MQTKKKQTQVAGNRVEAFLNAEATALGDIVQPVIRAKFDAALAAVNQFEAEQGATTRTAMGVTTQQAAQREDMVEHFFLPIAQAARMALKDSPDLPKLIVTAVARTKTMFAARATEVADAAALHEQELIGNGLRPTFLAEFRAAIAALNDSTVSRDRQLGRRKAATAGIEGAEAGLKEAIKMLDTLISPALKDNPSLLADWVAAKTIRQVPVTPLANGSGPAVPAANSNANPAAAGNANGSAVVDTKPAA